MKPEPKKKLLIVDDDELIRSSLARVLRMEGYAVAQAEDGSAALDWLRSNPRPCLILLDLMMPRMNGWEFSRELQKDPELADIPVVVISAHVELKKQATLIPALAYMEKPLELDDLLETIGKVC